MSKILDGSRAAPFLRFRDMTREEFDAEYPPVFLPPRLYDAAVREGCDMHGYVKQQPIPLK